MSSSQDENVPKSGLGKDHEMMLMMLLSRPFRVPIDGYTGKNFMLTLQVYSDV